MHAFKDSKDRTWELVINHTTATRVKAHLQLNLYTLVDDDAKGLQELLADPFTLMAVLYVLCAAQAEQRQVSEEDFGTGFAGDEFAAAVDAFVEEFLDFFADRRRRAALRNLVSKGKALSERLLSRAEQTIGSLDVAAVDLDLLAKKLSGSSGSALAASASTPAPSPSGSS